MIKWVFMAIGIVIGYIWMYLYRIIKSQRDFRIGFDAINCNCCGKEFEEDSARFVVDNEVICEECLTSRMEGDDWDAK